MTAKPTEEQIKAGQAAYSKSALAIYDILVLGISNSFIWECPSSRIEELYNKHASANHLDVGVGTGYFLDRCKFPSENPRVALMDLNQNTLDFTSERISRYKPETYRHNVFDPISTTIQPFDSVGVNYLLHCLPGSISEKTVVFDNLKALMTRNAVIFGSTILQGNAPRNWMARRLMRLYNKKGIFANTADNLESLKIALHQRLDNVEIELIGCVALFYGRRL
jgi:2-polyprenyl-3-methyl-5-hydroxy-6-metoxy-1,4-benzoquinol methylase